MGMLHGRTDDDVNAVNAPSIAESRGIEVVESRRSQARDFADLVRVTITSGGDAERVAGTTLGRQNRPHLLEAWGQRFNLQLEDHLALFRYRDVPGMIGRVGTAFGGHGINISSAAVGHVPERRRRVARGDGRDGRSAGPRRRRGRARGVRRTSSPDAP